MAYAVVRTDLMHATDVRGELVSLRYVVVTQEGGKTVETETEIENGHVLKVGALYDDKRELRKGMNVAANDNLRDIVLVATPEVPYDERQKSLENFINEAGRNIRGYRLHSGDIFSVTKEALDGANTPKVGDIVELKAGTKLNVVSTLTNGSTKVGKIVDINIVGRYTYYVIEVGEVTGVSA